MLRTSSYTIYVDLPEFPDQLLLVHGYTGAYDLVQREVGAHLRSLEPRRRPRPLYGEWGAEPRFGTADEGSVSDLTLDVLKRRGYLTEMSQEEEADFFSEFVGKLHARDRARPVYLFMPSYNCNLRCSYCFQDKMRTDPTLRPLLRLMSRDMVDRIFLGMKAIERDVHPDCPESYKRRIGFFGGEPLLEVTRPIVEYIINKAVGEGEASFWAVSNATELEHYEDLLGPEKIGEIQITLDGPPEEHDKRRVYADGSGSFEKIAGNIDLALQCGVEVSVRINVDRGNCSMLPALAEELASRGWLDHPRFGVYTAPIWAANDKTDPTSTFGAWELDREIERLRQQSPYMRFVGAPDDRVKSQVRKIFSEGSDPIPGFRASFCGAHTGMYIFDAFGDIYACWEKTGDKKVRIGQVEEGGTVELNGHVRQMWHSRTVTSNPICRKCRYSLYCGGGCAVRAIQISGEFFKNYCDTFQRRFRTSVAEAYTDFDAGRAELRQSRVCDL